MANVQGSYGLKKICAQELITSLVIVRMALTRKVVIKFR